MAEETVYLVKNTKGWKHVALEQLDGVAGFTTALLEAMDYCGDSDGEYPTLRRYRGCDGEDGLVEKWKEYMLDGGPKNTNHWVYTDLREDYQIAENPC